MSAVSEFPPSNPTAYVYNVRQAFGFPAIVVEVWKYLYGLRAQRTGSDKSGHHGRRERMEEETRRAEEDKSDEEKKQQKLERKGVENEAGKAGHSTGKCTHGQAACIASATQIGGSYGVHPPQTSEKREPCQAKAILMCSFWLKVLGTMTLLGFFQTSTAAAIDVQEVVPKPWIGPRELPVLGRPYTLECIVHNPGSFSYPDLSYSWYRDHTLIKANSDRILHFPHLTREDRGVYTCTASNGSVLTTSIDSNELDVLVLLPPVVHIEPTTPDHVIRATAGEDLILTCEVTEAIPWVDRYVWSYLPSPQGQLQPLEGRESTLTLGPLTREDRGQYFCQAWNDRDFKGEIPPGNASVTVDVLYLGDISLTPYFQVTEGENVSLTCQVDCNPPVRLSWVVDGQEVRHMTANIDHYVILSAACSDSKTYLCRASHPDLPGLEIHASTHVLVNCSRSSENVKLTNVTTVPHAADSNGLPLKIALPTVFGALVVAIVVLVFCLIKRRHNRQQRGRFDVGKNILEQQPMNGPTQSV